MNTVLKEGKRIVCMLNTSNTFENFPEGKEMTWKKGEEKIWFFLNVCEFERMNVRKREEEKNERERKIKYDRKKENE